MTILTFQLRRIAQALNKASEQRRCWFWRRRGVANIKAYAVVVQLAAEKIHEQAQRILKLETVMATVNENVKKALDALDASQASEATAKASADAATAALTDAKVNGILNEENTARLVAKFPEA